MQRWSKLHDALHAYLPVLMMELEWGGGWDGVEH